jgi:hypothetical protein
MKPINQTILRLTLLCWLFAFNQPGNAGNYDRPLADYFIILHGGCITSNNQTVGYEDLPATIIATVATGGTCGGYSYQWQWSRDQVFWTDIPGGTAQNLSFSNPITNYGFGVSIPETVYFQRRTTCGSEIQYTENVSVTRAVVYYNTDQSDYYYSNLCGSGETPEPYYVSVPPGTFSHMGSVAQANSLAINWAQDQANMNGDCVAYVSLPYTNDSPGPIYVTMTNVSTSQTYYFEMDAWTSSSLGSVPVGIYNIDIYDNAAQDFRQFYVGCASATTGFSAYFPNVVIDVTCNSFGVHLF